MARQSFVLQVFVASPSDVKEERELMESVVKQLNQTWSSTLGVTYELLKWETNVRPGFSTEPQAVINKQIGDEYDVFIGIFWTRIGTSTQTAVSGTVEEFQKAYSRRKEAGNNTPEIMLYFKEAAVPLSKINTQQLQGVLDFKKSISEMGGVYYSFEDLAGFESSLMAHLSAVAQNFVAKQKLSQGTTSHVTTVLVSDDATESEEDDYGYLDYLEIYEVHQNEMTSAIDRINEATSLLGQQLHQRSNEMTGRFNDNPKEARRLVKRVSDDMNNYAETMKSQLPLLSTARNISFNALSNSLVLQADNPNNSEELLGLRATLEANDESIEEAIESMQGMRDSAQSLPPISKEINKAKRAVVHEINAFISEVESIRSTVRNIIDSIDRMQTNDSKELE
jgi:hypothetical protein